MRNNMCIATNGKIIEISNMNATVECEGKKISAKINPAVSVKVGDEVIVFRNVILEKSK
jgi:hydrogenase maturation factor